MNAGDVLERVRYTPYGLPTFLDADFEPHERSQPHWRILYAGYWWDAESGLYQVRNRELQPLVGVWVTKDPVQADTNLYRYVANNPLINTDPLGLKKETVCCTQWTRRFVTLGYAYDQVGAMECILDQLGANPIYKAAITAAVASGTATAGGILRLLKINYAGTLGPFAALALEAKFLNDFVNAANYCRAYVCTQTVPKVEVTYTRSRWNPGYWIYGPEYTCLECPEGSEEAVLNEGTQATRDVRDDDPTIPAPPPGKKLVWPRTP